MVSSLAFDNFVLRDFANSLGRPENENMSLELFDGQEHQNCLTVLRSFPAIPHDV